MKREITGKYFGTEIDEKWWRRYTKNKMLSRGNGKFFFDEKAISFLRTLTKEPIQIDTRKIVELKTGKWHAGQWGAGKPILKILWKNNDQILSSGFSLSNKFDEVLSELKELTKLQDKNSI